MQRCFWAGNNPLMQKYHDTEWGMPIHDDRKIFEFLVLESMQAGLSWSTVLNKRENFRNAFAGFNPKKVARFTAADIKKLLNNAGIIRNRLKIKATINNAKIFLAVQKEFGSFSKYMWGFTGHKTINHRLKTINDYPTTINEAEIFAKDLKTRGFKFLGPTVIYAHMQAVGMVNDHMVNCFKSQALNPKPVRMDI